MRLHPLLRRAFPGLLLLGVLGSGELAFAAGTGLDDQPVVRRELLLRGSRFELAANLGGTLADAFSRNYMLGLQGQYYFDNWIGAGVALDGNLCSLLGDACKTALAEDVAAVSPRVESLDDVSAFSFVAMPFLSLIPMSGKIGLFKKIIHYDLHFLAGAAIVKVASLGDGDQLDDTLFGPAIGIGQRFFLGDSLAVTVSLRDLILNRVLNTTDTGAAAEAEYENNFVLSLGVSFFFPSQVQSSR